VARRNSEDQEQIAYFKWLQLQHPNIFDMAIHVPNGGKRSKAEGAIFKAMGVKKGFPDIAVFMPTEDFSGLMIEMKSAKGSPTPDQIDWGERLGERGYRWVICYGWQEAAQATSDYFGLPTRI
tara:strand:+ start:6377 stop:6745 length:369 start_codon:yes stop_codon:yes gene_type:complete